ncbi:saccharopine dehydrogenase NADP-binding domain-containing protein [Planomonospora venezuelensis]|uniref:Saccharopine dehydrogenase-like NADP-dependent oxidoreductase n=1 Tax=Planomonospora venezuelensis TaxID=1999 RepID=A0A841CUG5_PLAVE|nr:saccharopine dehydrogenase NADP-binding domain-containing protein [Planomonospora venezuelensis]MBB5960980.1 saccharopine dehydrogenase-like NADP-dependent oxidoreductase [Planomonospora venezuelensis]GIN01214.1 saccharopine dehydrogenase [Planomonospora venezuelensis]
MNDAPLFAIYGANGHTGRLVAAELLSRDQSIVLAGRDAAALEATAGELGSPGRVRTLVAPLDDPAALRELAESATVLVHCAGPYARTGEPVAAAAAAAGCHYVDHAVEPHHVRYMFASLQAEAERTGAVMIPQMSFYGGLADLLAAAVTEGMAGVDRVTVGYAVTGWRMTPGALRTAELLIGEIDRVTFADGAQHVGPVEIRNTVFPFPPPVGPRTMIAPFPSGEVVTIPRHVPARAVESQLTASTFEEEQVFTSQDADAAARARTEFTVAVQATAPGGGGRTGHVRGRDIWWVGALASVEAAVRLAAGEGPAKPGVLGAAEAFPATPFLRLLEGLGAFTLTV